MKKAVISAFALLLLLQVVSASRYNPLETESRQRFITGIATGKMIIQDDNSFVQPQHKNIVIRKQSPLVVIKSPTVQRPDYPMVRYYQRDRSLFPSRVRIGRPWAGTFRAADVQEKYLPDTMTMFTSRS